MGIVEEGTRAGIFEDAMRYWLRVPMRRLMVELLRRAPISVPQCRARMVAMVEWIAETRESLLVV